MHRSLVHVTFFLFVFLPISFAAVQVIESDQSGVTINFDLPSPKFSKIQPEQRSTYDLISYIGSSFTSKPGNPQVPTSKLMLGVPPETELRVTTLWKKTQTRQGFRILPTPYKTLRSEANNGFESSQAEWREDGSAYQKPDSLYPQRPVKIVSDGYIRSQRIIILEIHPIQYIPSKRSIQIHSQIRIRIQFQNPTTFANTYHSTSYHEDNKLFELRLQDQLLNYEQAKSWRIQSNKALRAPRIQDTQLSPRHKILLEKTGIYRVTSKNLKNKWGIDLSAEDPRNFHLRNNNMEIPLYIHGEEDGHFGQDDYIQFLGHNARNRYTRWNVYWLSIEPKRGKRIAEIDATPVDPTAKSVPSFRSNIYFEEDHLHSNLQHVLPENVSQGDKHAWFASIESWFWTGIRNGGDLNQMYLEFPLYDLASSFNQPKILVNLQGGTPLDHEILVSINDIRIDLAEWSSQDTLSINKNLRLWDDLKDASKGELNAISLARIDSTVEDDTTRYPYHVYINSFEIEYTRLLKAVKDYLMFSSPQSQDSHEVRVRRKLKYTIQTFLSPKIEIFEHDGKQLTAKMKNPHIQKIILDRQEQKRLLHIEEDLPTEIAYDATFQAPDSHDAKFVAVSSVGVLSPYNVETVQPSDLRSSTNIADYIVIVHPVYLEYAQELAAWRSTTKGGGHRTKVVDVTEIYNVFGDGIATPKAIKDFLSYAYYNWQSPAFSYVVLFGDGTWDFRGIDKETYPEPPETTGYIPTHYIWSQSFGQTSVDHWYTTISGIDELPDFYIGRISVETDLHARSIIDKIINYESNPPKGEWQRKIISIADDEVSNSGDFIFKKSLKAVEESHTLLGYETTRIFLEDVIKKVKANPAGYNNELPRRVAKDMVIDALSEGGVIAQYAGHGGRIVWTHEAIFDNNSVDLLDETNHLPFMLVLSCYNGYFDAPGEPSLAERLLRRNKGGIIGMLSASRLTYGSGNDALNRIIFDAIFKRNVREIGPLAMDSKVELLTTEGTGQIDVMMAYTLFGDPAMRLNMADYEIRPTIETRTVATGQNLKVKSGTIMRVNYDPQQKRKIYTPVTDFNGTLQLKAIFPGTYQTVQINPEEIDWDDSKETEIDLYKGDVIIEQKITIQNGKYPATMLTVPDGIREGQAHIECYASSTNATAVGGASFSVFSPKILDIQAKLINDKNFSVSVQVSDELNSKGIKSVILEWRDPLKYRWQEVAMEPDTNRKMGWYIVPSTLKVPESGEAIRYQISVSDIDGYEALSDILEFRPFVLPNLKSVNVQSSSESLIYYDFSKSKKIWELNADIEQTEPFELAQEVEIAFYSSNPDRNKDGIIDPDIAELGRAYIPSTAWRKRPKSVEESMPRAFRENPLNTNLIATAKIQHEFAFGQYEAYVCVDPDNKIKEISKDDNIGYGQLTIESTIIGNVDKRVFSRDNVLNLRFPKSSIAQPNILTVTKINDDKQLPKTIQQDSLNEIKLANQGNAYHIVLNNGQNTQLLQPITAEVNYDVEAIKEQIQTDLALDEIRQLSPDQIEAINAGLQLQAEEIGLYIWRDDLQKWLRQPTETIKAANGQVQIKTAVSNLNTSNQSDRVISSVKVDQNGVKVGSWIVMFTSPTTYRLMVRENNHPLEIVDPNRFFSQADVDTNFKDGLAITFTPGQKKFQFGDVLTFQVQKSNLQEGTATRYHAVSFQYNNDGSGILQYIQTGRKTNMPEDQWIILFLDADTFQIEGQRTGTLAKKGVVGKPYSNTDLDLHLQINAGDIEFSAGDRFRFETQSIGTIQAELSQLGTIALMRSDDTISPDIQLTISKQNFSDGDPVSKEPIIQATISDNNGVNPESIQLELSHNSRNFDTISEKNYDLSYRQGTNQIILNYPSPQLDPGGYQVRLTAKDLDGNQANAKTEFQVLKNFQMLKVMNYPNPFKRDTTITCELTMPADKMTVQIYTISGRMIWREEVNANAGFVMIPWEGRDSDGKKVSNGVYYCKINSTVGEKVESEIIKIMKLE